MKRCEKGFSLVEIAIAVLIIAVAMVPIISAIGFGGKGTHATTREILATSYGSSLLEYLINLEWGDIEEAWLRIRDDSSHEHEEHNLVDDELKYILGLTEYLLHPEQQDNSAWAAINTPQFESEYMRYLKLSRHRLYSMDDSDRDYMRIEVMIKWQTETGLEVESKFRGIKTQDGAS